MKAAARQRLCVASSEVESTKVFRELEPGDTLGLNEDRLKGGEDPRLT